MQQILSFFRIIPLLRLRACGGDNSGNVDYTLTAADEMGSRITGCFYDGCSH